MKNGMVIIVEAPTTEDLSKAIDEEIEKFSEKGFDIAFTSLDSYVEKPGAYDIVLIVCENPQIVWGFGIAYSFKLKKQAPFCIIYLRLTSANKLLKGEHLK